MYFIVEALHYLEFSGEVRGVLSMWAGNDRTVALQDLIEAVQDDLFDCSVPQQPVALSEITQKRRQLLFKPHIGNQLLNLYQLSGPEVRTDVAQHVVLRCAGMGPTAARKSRERKS